MSDDRKPNGRFAKGNKGGPGRPRGSKQIPDMLRRLLQEDTPDSLRAKVRTLYPSAGDTMLETIMRQVMTKAVNGERWAVEFIATRTEGKAVERVVLEQTDRMIESLTDEELEQIALQDLDDDDQDPDGDDDGGREG